MQQKKPKKPMTRGGFHKLAQEHEQLLISVRPKVVDGITIAAAEGDRSENAEYIYGKKRLREIDKRLRYLSDLLKDVEIIDPENIRSDRVEFGATVVVRDENAKVQRWSIVGMGEAVAERGTISYQSPLARGLMNRKVGDFFTLERPSGEIELEVVEIKYVQILP